MSGDIRMSKRRYPMGLCCPCQAGDTLSSHFASDAVRSWDLVGQETSHLPHKMS